MLKTFALDLQALAHRTVATFVQTFFGVWVITDITTIEVAVSAALAASLVPLKDWAVKKVQPDE